MIELTEQQVKALENAEGTPLRLLNPRTKDTYVLLPVAEYERVIKDEYDDTPWSKEEPTVVGMGGRQTHGLGGHGRIR